MKKRPYYRIVVTDQRNPRDGKFVERIGSYDPLLEQNKATIDAARAIYWLNVGAQPSDRVRKLLDKAGIKKGGTPPEPAVETSDATPVVAAAVVAPVEAPVEAAAETEGAS
mgnify:CR=1 FL=1